jgi:transposase
VISGIVHVLKSGGRWVDAPHVYGPRKTLYNRFVRWAAKGVWVDIFHALASAGGPPAEVLIDSLAVKAHRCSSGGDGLCRPIAFLLTGGRVADCTAGELLLEQMPKSPILDADKGYDTNAIRHKVEGKGTMPNIPPKANRRWKNCFSPFLPRSQCHRAHVRTAQRLPPHSHPVRPISDELPCGRLPRRHCHLLVMSQGTNSRQTARREQHFFRSHLATPSR